MAQPPERVAEVRPSWRGARKASLHCVFANSVVACVVRAPSRSVAGVCRRARERDGVCKWGGPLPDRIGDARLA